MESLSWNLAKALQSKYEYDIRNSHKLTLHHAWIEIRPIGQLIYVRKCG